MNDEAISELLDQAVNNDNNENITSHTLSSIENTKVSILDEIALSDDDRIKTLDKLDGYRHVDELPEFPNRVPRTMDSTS